MTKGSVDKLVLHIGVPKTGSTSIQATFASHAKDLRTQGWLYPSFQTNHFFLVSAFKDDPENLDFNRLAGRKGDRLLQHDQKVITAFHKAVEQSGCRNVVLSSEHLTLLNDDEVAKLKSFLLDFAACVEIVAYARNPAFQALSLIQEQVKNGARRVTQCFQNPPIFLYREILERWTRQFGKENVTVLPFPGDALAKGDVVEHFARHIGVWNDERQMRTVTTNESLSGTAVMIADALSAFAPKYSKNRHLKRDLFKIAGPKFRLPADLNSRVLSRAQPELQYLEDEHGVSFPAIEPPSAPYEPGTYFTDEALASIARCLNDLAAKSK